MRLLGRDCCLILNHFEKNNGEGRTIEIIAFPIHLQRACRENRDDKKRYRAKTPRTHLTGKSLSRKGAKAAKFEEERILFAGANL